ncbi:hypothetical protein CWC05_18330, partial [Pseudoalteromonas ruthenica]
DYAIWQRQLFTTDYLKADLDYWLSALDELPGVHRFPTDRPRPSVQSHCGAVITSVVKVDITHRLQQYARTANVTLFMILHSALTVVL